MENVGNSRLKLCFLTIILFSAVSSTAPSVSSPDLKFPFFPHSSNDYQRLRKMVDDINAMRLPWKAEYNPFAAIRDYPEQTESRESIESQNSDEFDPHAAYTWEMGKDTGEHERELMDMRISLPESFDARDKWPRCASLHNIRNQGGCGSCWAAATVSMLSDRRCISSNYTQQQMISLQDLVSCCGYCGSCDGGRAGYALLYWKKTGIVTGGAFGSNEGCKPYEIESTCGVPCPRYFYTESSTPKCSKKCDKLYGKTYEDDLKQGKSIYQILNDGRNTSTYHELIKKEIITHGSVLMSTHVTEPFAHYRSGVYTACPFSGNESMSYGHAMRIIGWGEDKGEEYWTIANSWGRQWGENGYGRISVNYLPERIFVAAGLW